MDELRRKNNSLVKEVERLSMQAEKPLEQQLVSSCSAVVLLLLCHCMMYQITTLHFEILGRSWIQLRVKERYSEIEID